MTMAQKLNFSTNWETHEMTVSCHNASVRLSALPQCHVEGQSSFLTLQEAPLSKPLSCLSLQAHVSLSGAGRCALAPEWAGRCLAGFLLPAGFPVTLSLAFQPFLGFSGLLRDLSSAF